MNVYSLRWRPVFGKLIVSTILQRWISNFIWQNSFIMAGVWVLVAHIIIGLITDSNGFKFISNCDLYPLIFTFMEAFFAAAVIIVRLLRLWGAFAEIGRGVVVVVAAAVNKMTSWASPCSLFGNFESPPTDSPDNSCSPNASQSTFAVGQAVNLDWLPRQPGCSRIKMRMIWQCAVKIIWTSCRNHVYQNKYGVIVK